jgi:hypothetical protein
MKINRIHATLGFLLIVVPLLGFGHDFKNGFSIFSGTVILFFAVQSIQNEYRKKHRRPMRHDSFVEGRPPEPKQGEVVEDFPTDSNLSQ